MEVFYSGKDDGLFTVYYSPNQEKDMKVGIIFVLPFGYEYSGSYLAICELAKMLSNIGYHIIRFEFSGVGDSYGDLFDQNLTNWIKELDGVHQDFVDSGLINKIYLFGFRFGASILCLFGEKFKSEDLILWQPILNGEKYFSRLGSLNKFYLNNWVYDKKNNQNGSDQKNRHEYFGYELGRKLYRDLLKIDLNTLDEKFCKNCFVLGYDRDTYYHFDNCCKRLGINFQYIQLSNEDFWFKTQEEIDKSLIPRKDLELISKLFEVL